MNNNKSIFRIVFDAVLGFFFAMAVIAFFIYLISLFL